MNSLNIKKDDIVLVLSGHEKGKKGKVLSTVPSAGMVLVEGVNIVSRHTRPRRQTETGGIIKAEAPIRASKVIRVCPKCGQTTRHAVKLLENGDKVRVCKKCGKEI